MKRYLDERQQQEMSRTGTAGFYVIFFLCAVSVIVQLVFLGSGFADVAGETAALLGGGLIYLVRGIRHGLFLTAGRQPGIKESALYSVILSGMFSVLFCIALRGKARPGAAVEPYVGIFFLGMAILCFAVTLILGVCSNYMKARRERQYDEESGS